MMKISWGGVVFLCRFRLVSWIRRRRRWTVTCDSDVDVNNGERREGGYSVMFLILVWWVVCHDLFYVVVFLLKLATTEYSMISL